ncbi:hypothetical protein ACJX0J_005836 [Zea mays]
MGTKTFTCFFHNTHGVLWSNTPGVTNFTTLFVLNFFFLGFNYLMSGTFLFLFLGHLYLLMSVIIFLKTKYHLSRFLGGKRSKKKLYRYVNYYRIVSIIHGQLSFMQAVWTNQLILNLEYIPKKNIASNCNNYLISLIICFLFVIFLTGKRGARGLF